MTLNQDTTDNSIFLENKKNTVDSPQKNSEVADNKENKEETIKKELFGFKSKVHSKWIKRREKRDKEKFEMLVMEKEASILASCNDLIKNCEKIKIEIMNYPKQENNSEDKQKMIVLFKELDKLAQSSGEQMVLINHKIKCHSVIEKSRPVGDKSAKKKGIVGNIIFYGILLLVVIFMGQALATQTESGVPKNIAGYAPMTILTGSMQSVYPKNSLVVAKVIDSRKLKIGDDITFMKENNTTVTHRIVGIIENYQNTGERGFETKGIENPRKDEEVVQATNVIGKIIYSSNFLGQLIIFIRKNMLLTLFTALVMIFGVDWFIRYVKMSFEKAEIT